MPYLSLKHYASSFKNNPFVKYTSLHFSFMKTSRSYFVSRHRRLTVSPNILLFVLSGLRRDIAMSFTFVYRDVKRDI